MFLGRSRHFLESFRVNYDGCDRFSSRDALAFEDVAQLAEPGYLPLENGYVRARDGSLYVAVLTDLGKDVTGSMFDWWFTQVDNSEKYRWWHPLDHFTGTWDPSYYGAMPFERPAGHYIDHVHIVDEAIGGARQSLQIEFLRPSKYFDTSRFAEQGITACLVGRLHVHDAMLGMLAAGYLVHMVRQLPDGRSELRSRFWVGSDVLYDETPESFFTAHFVNFISKFYLFKLVKIPFQYGRDIYKHCSEEMNCLKEFLPHYFEAAKKDHRRFQEKYKFT